MVRIHLICIGDEILHGRTLNTNLAFIGDALSREGYSVGRETCVPDEPGAITAALRAELSQADVVVTVGGLGPTSDDVTRPVVSEALGLALRLDADLQATIEAYLAQRHVRIPREAVRLQAMVPETAIVLPNRAGTAPGLWCPRQGGAVVMLPGPPREFQPMVTECVLPRVRELAPPAGVACTLRACGLPESVVAESVEAVLEGFCGIGPAYCAQPAQVTVRLSASADRKHDLEAARQAVATRLGDSILPDGAASLPEAVGQLLRGMRYSMATAESCTGGMIAAAVTDVPGSSDYFAGSVVSYSNAWKAACLGVTEETLAAYGAVSRETAAEMLDGLRQRHHVDAGVAVTGVAGPGGGTAEKPLGLVFIASGVRGDAEVNRFVFPGDRASVRLRTTSVALNQLRLQLLAHARATRACEHGGREYVSTERVCRAPPARPVGLGRARVNVSQHGAERRASAR